MDVGELLSFQPEKPAPISAAAKKRKNDRNAAEARGKQRRVEDLDDYTEKEKIMALLDDADESTEGLDEGSLKKMLLQFEKRVLRNQEMRIKYPDLPEKFMESEMELNDILQEMHVIATMPNLYHILVSLNAVHSLMQLIGHDNTDISIGVIDLIQELTDVDALNESEEDADILVDTLLEGQVVAVLVQNLDRLDESIKEEADGVHNTLGVIENITEFRPELCPEAAKAGLMQWILKRIKAKMPFDANKLYCSEILAILLQNHEDNRQLLGEMDGIDVLLQQLAIYKKHDPANSEEVELMENLFNCLCSSLMLSSNKDRFLKGEGLQLMILMLREKKMSRHSAIKVLDHAMTGSDGSDNCQKFIDILGLRSVFPIFMKTPKVTKKGTSSEELEEHIASVIANLLKNCQGSQRQRLLSKFTENDHEKVDRLMELHFKYLDKVRVVDQQIEKERNELKRYGKDLDDDEEEQDRYYLQRLEAGLFTLQLVDYIMLDVCASGATTVKQRVMQILNMRGGSVKAIRNIMREYAGNIGETNDAETREAEQNKLVALVDKF
ncbi:beta-catenin-like protein 1 [Tubulanus polymorphus]|uniref:beta-catenin-like protein 1 n=1 Tax=Tubulanus polymorphus TaxID=672921 RepID=UPI003DA55255